MFENKDRVRKLIYQDEIVSKVNKDNGGFFSKMFEEKTTLTFQRYSYLSDEEEEELYKRDPVRPAL